MAEKLCQKEILAWSLISVQGQWGGDYLEKYLVFSQFLFRWRIQNPCFYNGAWSVHNITLSDGKTVSIQWCYNPNPNTVVAVSAFQNWIFTNHIHTLITFLLGYSLWDQTQNPALIIHVWVPYTVDFLSKKKSCWRLQIFPRNPSTIDPGCYPWFWSRWSAKSFDWLRKVVFNGLSQSGGF